MKAGWMTMLLASAATFAFMFMIGTSGAGVTTDMDGDGWQDDIDNCKLAANPSQIDTDFDGYGNQCDADSTNDGVVGSGDFGAFVASFQKAEGDTGFNPNIDYTGDDVVGSGDFGIFVSSFQGTTGPSGRACANVRVGMTGNPTRCPDPELELP